jgi:pilus assembly protein Flp/PilA
MSAILRTLFSRFAREQSGATAIEYGLIVGLMFLAIVTAVKNVSAENVQMYNTIDTTLASATTS